MLHYTTQLLIAYNLGNITGNLIGNVTGNFVGDAVTTNNTPYVTGTYVNNQLNTKFGTTTSVGTHAVNLNSTAQVNNNPIMTREIIHLKVTIVTESSITG